MKHSQGLQDRAGPSLNTRASRSTVEQIGEEMTYLPTQATK
jgi:hypothetical protein